MEPGGGTVDESGTYIAPETEGTYTLVASLDSIATSGKTQVRVKRNVRVNVSPSEATLAPGESLAFAAEVTGNEKTVTWSVPDAEGGTITAEGVYTAPQTAGTYEVVATSTADVSKSGVATITVTAVDLPPPAPTVSVTISPLSTSIVAGTTFQFKATVTGSTDTGVTWSVREAGGGTVTTAGVYTAPSTAGTYHVVATSSADPTSSAATTVTVTAPSTPTTPTLPPGVVPAFPGAQGGGALSKGGRGGAIYEVTNLNDSGTGSLRACLQASGARTCVFRVAGTIRLSGALEVRNPYVTVAGQTAPGGGILIAGKSLNSAVIRVYTHDVTWRYTKIRKGYYDGATTQYGDVVKITDGSKNVIFDHNSLSWAQDENVGIAGDDTSSGGPDNITISWNLVAEPLKAHPTSMMTGGANVAAMTEIDFHHNLVMNSSHRNPQISSVQTRLVNNVFYNWSYWGTRFYGSTRSDVIGNLYRRGPINQTSGTRLHEVQHASGGTPSLYVTGNKGPFMSPTTDNWSSVYEADGGGELNVMSTSFKRTTPMASPVGGVAIVADSVSTLESKLLPIVGASQRLDCNGNWVQNRDAVDNRLVSEYQNLRGFVPATESDVGGFPAIASGTACSDADHDGMPDAWESANGSNQNDASDRNTVTSNGFTRLETYLGGR